MAKGNANDRVKASGKPHKPPSRLRYEATHPTIAIRVSQDIYDKLMEIRTATGQSWGAVLKVALGLEKAAVKNSQAIYTRGFDEAKARYCITFPCSVCGKPVELTGDEAKKAAATYMQQARWRHGECTPPRV